MKSLIFAAIICFTGMSSAYAQNVNVDSKSSTNTSTNSTSVSGLQNSQQFITNNPGTVEYSGRYSLRNVPSMALGSFGNSFSSDYCNGTVQGSFGIAGLGVAGGSQKLDEGCQLLRASDMLMRMEGAWRAEAKSAWDFASMLESQHIEAIKHINGNQTDAKTAYEINMLAADARSARQIAFDKAAMADKIELSALYNVCSISPKIRKNMTAADIQCPDDK